MIVSEFSRTISARQMYKINVPPMNKNAIASFINFLH